MITVSFTKLKPLYTRRTKEDILRDVLAARFEIGHKQDVFKVIEILLEHKFIHIPEHPIGSEGHVLVPFTLVAFGNEMRLKKNNYFYRGDINSWARGSLSKARITVKYGEWANI